MYKEYRSNTICGAVSQLYIDLAGKHSGRAETVQIIRTKVINKIAVPGEESDKPTLKRASAIAFTKKGEQRFPKTDRRIRAPIGNYKSTFKANRPILF